MLKSQAIKNKVTHLAIATMLALGLATLGFVTPAFAAPVDTQEGTTEIYVWQSTTSNPGDISVTFPVKITAALYQDDTAINPDLLYETVSYLANQSLTDQVLVESIKVVEGDFTVLSQSAFETGAPADKSLWTTIGGTGVSKIDLGIRNASDIINPGWILEPQDNGSVQEVPLNFKGAAKATLANTTPVHAYDINWTFKLVTAP